MNVISNRKLRSMLLASGLAVMSAAQAQNVIVRTPDNADELRANIEASMRAAAAGQRVGMLTGMANPQQQRAGRGTVSQELDASTLMYSVARINADGKLERVCVSGSDAAQKALTAPEFAKRLSPIASKEHSNVK
jgi:hypothetical protein